MYARSARCLDDHLSRRTVTGPLVQPTRNSREASRLPHRAPKHPMLCFCLALLRMRVTWPRYYYQRRWSLTLAHPADFHPRGCSRKWLWLAPKHFSPFHPYPFGAVCFCGPIWQIAPPRELPGIPLFGVRTFLDYAALHSRDHPTSLKALILPLRSSNVKPATVCVPYENPLVGVGKGRFALY